MAEIVVITGLSGAGRSQAGAASEDLGWYVMDNIPTPLIAKVADLVPESLIHLEGFRTAHGRDWVSMRAAPPGPPISSARTAR